MSSAGPNFPSTGANDATVGTRAWGTTGNITAEDGLTAAIASLATGGVTEYLMGTGFGFAIPAGATINGIMLEVKARAFSGHSQEYSVKLVKGGVIAGSDRSAGTTLFNALTYMSYGGASDLWGQSWSAADINDGTFGAVWACTNPGVTENVFVDAFRITVYYTAAGTANTAGNFFRFF